MLKIEAPFFGIFLTPWFSMTLLARRTLASEKRAHFARGRNCTGRERTLHRIAPSIHPTMRSKDRCRSLSLPVRAAVAKASAGKIEGERETDDGGQTSNSGGGDGYKSTKTRLLAGRLGGGGTSEHHPASQVLDFTLPSLCSWAVELALPPFLFHDSGRLGIQSAKKRG